ncbi:glycerol-3-phosphate 1-O-acyltransferase PlsY [Candidatus Aerophobetes bacterium]|nr:glycerol-3-phosphate 1-O-acyltransferase PlsY [Candidatus Aerophobetes bacterium]
MSIHFILVLFISYLLGSISWGYLMGKFTKKIDLRNFGSGNTGFANALRVLGVFPGIIVLAGDIGKGILAVEAGNLVAPYTGINPQVVKGMAGLFSIIGHNWSVFLKFRGGKGVATSAGVFMILTPFPFLFSLLIMGGVLFFTRYFSLGSMLSSLTLPLFIWLWQGNGEEFYLVLSGVVAGLILFRHQSNIKRLLRGKERKLGEKIRVE